MRKRDISTTIGLFFGLIAILVGMTINKGKFEPSSLKLFFDLPSVFITLGGSFFTILIAFPLETVKRLPVVLKNAFIEKKVAPEEIIESFTELSKKARKEGLLSLEDDIENIEDAFLKSGIQMVVDGLEPETIRDILELEVEAMEKRHAKGINLLKSWAGYAPAYGMIGTLIGLVQMLANLNNADALGPGMAKAIITSFYGSVLANFVFGPLSAKLELKSEQEAGTREMMLEGILSIQAGVNPRVIEDKLKTYLSPEEKLGMYNISPEGEAVLDNE